MRIISLALAVALLFPSLVQADLAGDINQILASKKPGGRVGISLRSLSNDRVIYEKNSHQIFATASNMKLVTTAAALDYLGQYYQFRTKIYTQGIVHHDVLHGNLWVVGGADPNISGRFYKGDPRAVFRQWARQLKKRGINKIAGDLLLDDRLFDRRLTAPGWPMSDQWYKWYCAPVSPLSFNDNCVDVTVKARAKKPQRPRVTLSPPTRFMRVSNGARTSHKTHNLRIFRHRRQNILYIRNWLPRNRTVKVSIAVTDPTAYFGHVLKEVLQAEGIKVGGKPTRVGPKSPKDAKQMVIDHNFPLAKALPIINKRSQNLHAELVFKLLGAKHGGEGSFAGGQKVLLEYLKRAGIEDGVVVKDGSGLSRENQMSPDQITSFLDWVMNRPYGETFRKSLSIAGKDGTLRRRMKHPLTRGKVFAKTGTLNRVTNVSGYFRGKRGWYAFSIMMKGHTIPLAKAKGVQDHIVRAMIKATR